MLLNQDFILPAELTGYARMAAANYPANAFRLAGWLPRRPVDDLEYRFTQGGDALIEAAPFRAYDAEASIASRPGVVRKSGSLPPISRKLLLTEYDRLRQRANPELTMRQSIFGDAERVVRQIATRLEVARGDALLNGSVTIAENGVQATVDFGRPSACSVTASTLWSTVATSDPVNDLIAWNQAYIDLNGLPPAVLLTSVRVRGLMQQSAAIRALAAIGGVTPTIVDPTKLNTILDSFNLPRIVTYDARYSVAGTATRVIPDKYGLLLPPEVTADDYEGTQLGATFTGTTAESLDPSYGIEEGAEPGIVCGVYREEDPISLWTKAAEIALPVVANPQLCWRLTLAS